MKHIMLMRHAEAAQKEVTQHDRDRPLTRKGLQDARHLHSMLLAEGLMPPFVLASDAIRTDMTAREVTGAEYEGELQLEPELYNAGHELIIQTAQLLDDRYKMSMIIAHNPGIYETVLYLLDRENTVKMARETKGGYKPGTMTVLSCPAETWSSLSPDSASISRIFVPRS